MKISQHALDAVHQLKEAKLIVPDLSPPDLIRALDIVQRAIDTGHILNKPFPKCSEVIL